MDRLIIDKAGRKLKHAPLTVGHALACQRGVWVYYAGHTLPASATDEMLQQIREERDLANLGKAD